MESKNLERGIQLVQLGRFTEAIPYFQKSLAENPDNTEGKYYLAICHFNIGNITKAEELSDALLHDNPNDPDTYFLKARIALHNDKNTTALEFVSQAITLAPYVADYFGFKASILLQNKDYKEGLAVTNEGLAINPKNAFCLNIRAQILTKLDRVDEANTTVEHILADNPEDCYSHANVGWVALENGNVKKALHHFKQALQLDPNFEYARQGMSTALKGKNFIYRWYLKYSFWIAKKSTKNQWFFIIGIYVAYRLSLKLLTENSITYLAVPLVVLYLLFVLGGWIMEPLSNTILNFDKYGKYLLDKNQKRSGYAFGGLLAAGLTALAIFYAAQIDYALVLAITFICTLVPLPRAFLLRSKRGRTIGFSYSVLMLAIGVFGPLFIDFTTVELAVFILFVAYTWIGNFIEK